MTTYDPFGPEGLFNQAMNSQFEVKGVDIYYNGAHIGCRESNAEAIAYVQRLIDRYAEDSFELLLGSSRKPFKDGYLYKLPDGDWPIDAAGFLPASSVSAARKLLLDMMNRESHESERRERLPNGTTIEPRLVE